MVIEKRLKIRIFIFLMLLLSSLSIFAFVYSYDYQEQERRKYADLPTTDLSTIAIDGQQIGEYVYIISNGTIIIDCEDGKRYFSDSDLTGVPSNANLIRGRLFGEESCIVNFNNQNLTTVKQCISVIGNNYLTRHSVGVEETVYLDHKNNIQLTLSEYDDGQRKFIEIKRIDPQIYMPPPTSSYSDFWGVVIMPSLIFDLIKSIIIKKTLLSITDYILIPVFYAALMLPIMYMFFRRNKKSILVGVVVISYLLFNHFVILPILMSV